MALEYLMIHRRRVLIALTALPTLGWSASPATASSATGKTDNWTGEHPPVLAAPILQSAAASWPVGVTIPSGGC